jgi:hypothetical protein
VKTDMGGESATLAPETSVQAMLKLIEQARPEDGGRFLAYDGAPLPW